MYEFICEHCGIHVVQIIGSRHPENTLCQDCRFIDGLETEAEKEQARRFLRRGDCDKTERQE